MILGVACLESTPACAIGFSEIGASRFVGTI